MNHYFNFDKLSMFHHMANNHNYYDTLIKYAEASIIPKDLLILDIIINSYNYLFDLNYIKIYLLMQLF